MVAEHPEVAARLRDALAQWARRHGWELGGAAVAEIDPETRRELEALGYVF